MKDLRRLSKAEIDRRCEKHNVAPRFDYADFKNANTLYPFICLNSHCSFTFQKTLNKLKSQGCPNCSRGLYERLCRVALERIFGHPFPKKRPEGLKNSRGNQMELDGFCEKLRIAFEHHGKHHYSTNSHIYQFLKGKKKKELALKQRKSDDRRKRQWCNENKIALLEIPEIETLTKLSELRGLILKKCTYLELDVPFPDTQIDYKKAYTHDPTKLFKEALRDKKIKVDLKNWFGTQHFYDHKCLVCKYRWNRKLTISSGCPKCHKKSRTKHTKENLLSEVQKLYKELGRPPMAKEIDASKLCPGYTTYRKHFNTIENILLKADIPFKKSRWSDQEIFEAIKEFSGNNKIAPTYKDFRDNVHLPSPSVIYKRFGKEGIKTATKLAGIEYSKKLEYDKELLILLLREFAFTNNNKPPKEKELAPNGLPSIATFSRHFGSYNEAVKESKLISNRETNHTDEELLQKLNRLYQKIGRPPKLKDIELDSNMPHSSMYRIRFGSFQEALSLAKIPNTKKKPMTKTFTDQEIGSFCNLLKSKFKTRPTNQEIDDLKGPSVATLRRRLGNIEDIFN